MSETGTRASARLLPRRALAPLAAGLLASARAARASPPPRRIPIGLFPDSSCPAAPHLAAFEALVGRRLDLGLDFIDKRLGWNRFLASADWQVGCWRGTGLPLALGVPMLMQGPHPSLRRAAAGEFDVQFRALARSLAGHNQAGAILRLGWEFNGDWYHWAAGRDPAAFVAAWRRIVGVMRSVPGARFRFDWNPTLLGITAPEPAYPGDDVVDIVGLDIYNECWPFIADPARRWDYLMQHRSGLRWHRDFAAGHGKPRAFPEWGTGTRKDGHGGGDDPLFVRNMLAWMQMGGPVAYACWWNSRDGEYDGVVTGGHLPAAAAALRAGLGVPA